MNRPATALRTFPKLIEAACYNRARLALRRLGWTLRVAIGGHRRLEVILDDLCWLWVDGFYDDVPVLAWCRFDTRERWDLRAPVPCSLQVCHLHGGVVMGAVLEARKPALDQRLGNRPRRLS
jgi:hypothetical protein